MLFKDRHIPLIRAGEKTVTRRDWAENYNPPTEGSVLQCNYPALANRLSGVDSAMFIPKDACDCFIRVTAEPYQEALGEMGVADAQREGDYETLGEFIASWREINGEWDAYSEVWVVPFEYAGRESEVA